MIPRNRAIEGKTDDPLHSSIFRSLEDIQSALNGRFYDVIFGIRGCENNRRGAMDDERAANKGGTEISVLQIGDLK